MPDEPEGLAHALMELSRQAERVTAVDAREASHFQQIAGRLEQFGQALTAVEECLTGMQAAVALVDELRSRVDALAAKMADVAPDEPGDAKVYRPGAAPRWWK